MLCTINPVNFLRANRKVISRHQARFARHYELFQGAHVSIIRSVNGVLTGLNRRAGLVTPFLHSWVCHFSRAQVRLNWSYLSDGIHPTERLADKWERELLRARRLCLEQIESRSRQVVFHQQGSLSVLVNHAVTAPF